MTITHNCDLGPMQLDHGIAAIDLGILISSYVTHRNPLRISIEASAVWMSKNFERSMVWIEDRKPIPLST